MLSDPEFWVAVSFVIFLAIIVWVGTKPVLKALDERAARIKGLLDQALDLRNSTERMLADERQRHGEALKQAEAIVAHSRDEAERQRQAGLASIEASLKRRERAALERIEQAEARAVQEVRRKAIDIALAATRSLLKHGLDPKRAAAIVDAAIGEIPQKLH